MIVVVVVVFAMFVEMVTFYSGFYCQKHEFAIIFVIFLFAGKTDTTPFLTSLCGLALIFVSKFLHFIIVRECLDECPFNVVRCAKDLWSILGRHQIRFR